MSLRTGLDFATRLIVAIACVSTTYLYLYPVWSGCAFPSTTGTVRDGFQNALSSHLRLSTDRAHVAPFRFLVLADPQLEGDSSLPDPEDALFARVKAHWARIQESNRTDLRENLLDVARQLATADIPNALWTVRKSMDLFGNDYYLAHIYRSLHWWTNPTHVIVLGDLIGSQWVSDDEFEWRGWRYWNRVFAGSEKVDEDFMSLHENNQDNLIRPDDKRSWRTKIMNIAGNHDIGYAGDISKDRIDRFERVFGRANWDIKFPYPGINNSTHAEIPSLHVIVLNDMVLDGPHMDSSLQSQTYEYLNNLITQPRLLPVTSDSAFTLLLTHVPLHKREGICVDAPFFSYWPSAEDDEIGPGGNGAYEPEGLQEQNHLSEGASKQILQSLFGMNGNLDSPGQGKGRNGLILTGHDHEGCDVVHYIKQNPDYVEPQDDDSSAENIPVADNSAAEHHADADSPPVAVSEPGPNSDPSLVAESDSASTETHPAPTVKTSLGDIEVALAQPQPPTEPWSWHANHTLTFTPPLPNTLHLPNSPHYTSTESEDIHTSLREITLRSMMGSYGGNAGLLSLWYDFEQRQWQYEMVMCPLGVQHVWWAVHVVDIIAVVLLLTQGLLRVLSLKPPTSTQAAAPAHSTPSRSRPNADRKSIPAVRATTSTPIRNANHSKKNSSVKRKKSRELKR